MKVLERILASARAPSWKCTSLSHGPTGCASQFVWGKALGIRRYHGVQAHVAVSAWTIPSFHRNFPAAVDCGVLVGYDDTAFSGAAVARALAPHAPRFDVVVSTFFTTVDVVRRLVSCWPNLAPAYFVQVRAPAWWAPTQPRAGRLRTSRATPRGGRTVHAPLRLGS